MMASRIIGILIVAFLSYALVANGSLFSFPGPQDDQSSGEIDSQTNDRVLNGSEQQTGQIENRFIEKPLEKEEVGVEPAQPDPKPVQEPSPEPVPERPAKTGLQNNFYAQSCPDAESIVNATLQKHFLEDPSYAPSFPRLFFHDCFVTVRFSISNSVSSCIF